MSIQAHARARAAADRLRARTGVDRYTAAVVLGSGWEAAADALGAPRVELDATLLPGFVEPAALGHHGVVRSVPGHRGELLVFLGRPHLYEGTTRTRWCIACAPRWRRADTVVLTNAAGSSTRTWK